ncbi:YqcI/YcgG family protein [Polaromonas glacialis]|uniref:YqcI/YcgG family protein n=1 Tax=Polaromonas glacialis TaxID=866564 RepID=UPI0004969BBB
MLYWPDHLFMFRNNVFDSWFPCIDARSAQNSGKMKFGTYSALGSEPSAQSLRDELSFLSRIYKSPSAGPLFFVVMFEQQ